MYERLGLTSILQSLHIEEHPQPAAMLRTVEGCKGGKSSSSSSSSLSRQSTTTTTTQTNDANTIDVNENGTMDGDDAPEASVDARMIDALFARITASAALLKKSITKKTAKSKKKGGIAQGQGLVFEEEDEGGMLLVEVSEEQQRVALALAELEISLQGVSVCFRMCVCLCVCV